MVIKHGPFLPEEFITLYDYVTLQEIGIQIPSSQIMDIALQHFINHEMHLSQTGNVSKINFCSHSILANWKFFIQIRFKVFFNANDVKKDLSNFGRHWIFKWNIFCDAKKKSDS